jgi:hypothetical protein
LTVTGDPKAQPYTLAQGKALAMMTLDILTNPDLMTQIKADFKADMTRG